MVGIHCNYTPIPGGGGRRGKQYFQVNLPEFFYLKEILHTKIQRYDVIIYIKIIA